jgi:hypothetical protein
MAVGGQTPTSSAHPSQAPALDHLSDQEIAAAVAAKPNSGFVSMEDQGLMASVSCNAQMPSETIFTPSGLLNALSINAKKQFLRFKPQPQDTLRALTVISKGCANGTAAGPVCDSITRVALISDAGGTVVAEAAMTYPLSSTWQNGYGATAACSAMVSKFSMADVAKVRNSKGEFLIVTFSGSTQLKQYTVKQKHMKALGL